VKSSPVEAEPLMVLFASETSITNREVETADKTDADA